MFICNIDILWTSCSCIILYTRFRNLVIPISPSIRPRIQQIVGLCEAIQSTLRLRRGRYRRYSKFGGDFIEQSGLCLIVRDHGVARELRRKLPASIRLSTRSNQSRIELTGRARRPPQASPSQGPQRQSVPQGSLRRACRPTGFAPPRGRSSPPRPPRGGGARRRAR